MQGQAFLHRVTAKICRDAFKYHVRFADALAHFRYIRDRGLPPRMRIPS